MKEIFHPHYLYVTRGRGWELSMEYIVTAQEMKKYDSNTTDYFKIPPLVLMERAALCVVEEMVGLTGNRLQGKNILVLAGSGNNGGDGFAIARLLKQKDAKVELVFFGKKEMCTEQTRQQMQICEKYKVPMTDRIGNHEYDIMIDALFGIGLNRIIEGNYADMIRKMNEMDAFRIAIDIPSGVHADDGTILGEAVKADLTVTFGFQKRGHIFYPGTEYCGKVVCRDIGITQESLLGEKPLMYSYQTDDIERMPKRNPAGNKGSFGKVLLIAGSKNMSGACVLAGLSAYRCGAGLVRIMTSLENREIIQKMLPEAVLVTYQCETDVTSQIEWADCVAIGPGIGTSTTAQKIVKTVLQNTLQNSKKVVIDADALNLIASNVFLQKLVKENTQQNTKIIMTPHMGEFSRLTGKTIAQLKAYLPEEIKAYADSYKVTLVCKDARTICYDYEEEQYYINQSGNAGMATAGAGDVLTGMLAAILAQKMDVMEAACLGVYLHGLAGDWAAQQSNQYSVMAHDIAEAIPNILHANKNRK